MAILANARTYVENPHAPNLRQRYGLFQVAPPMDLPRPEAGIAGLEYESPWCAGTHGLTVNACAPSANKTFDAGFTDITGDPFVVYASASCGAVANPSARVENLVRQRLLVGEQAAVENAFSQQANGQNPGLAHNPAVVTLAAATSITGAISTLEGWLYGTMGYGLPGVIHAPAATSAYFREVNSFLFSTEGGEGAYRTPLGTEVSLGSYSGLAADGSAPAAGHTTMYITGRVAIWRDSDPNIFMPPFPQVVNKTTNQYFMIAERTYIIAIDCYVAAVDVVLA